MLRSKNYYLILYTIFFSEILLADSISSVIPIKVDGHQYAGPVFACFDSENNNFLISFFADNSYCSLYDAFGNVIVAPRVILNSNDHPVAFSAPISCYNSTNNQFLISYVGWHGDTSTYYSILDHALNTVVGPIELENPIDDVNTKMVYCCYNSINNQYLIVWTTACSYAYFVILDASGNIVVPRTEIDAVSVGDGRGVYVTYNAINNQYLFTWQDDVTNYPYFAIYDEVGSQVISPTIISDVTSTYATFVSSAYNSIDNQYMVVWNDTANTAYFIIYDALGSVVIPTTPIVANAVDITGGGGLVVSYNSLDNEYLISWNGSDSKIYYKIYSNQGIEKLSTMSVASPNQGLYSVLKSNAYAVSKNMYWLGWHTVTNDSSEIYFILYKRDTLHSKSLCAEYVNSFNAFPWNITKETNIAGLSYLAPRKTNNFLISFS